MDVSGAYVDHYAQGRVQTWRTPRDLFDTLHYRFGFNTDGAASFEDKLLADFDDGDRPWDGRRVFCNPPWSDIPPFIEKAATADLAVLLVPARVNARWFHRALALGARVEFFMGRPSFKGPAKTGHNSPIDCLLLIFGDDR